MCYRIKIEKEKRLASISAYGKVDVFELKEIFYETVRHENWQSGFDMLCDYRKIKKFAVTSQDIDNIIEWQKSIDSLIGDGRCAVVASRDFIYGMNRMWEILSEERSQQIRVFRQMDEAVCWLSNQLLEQ